ncbi:hypothetical protein [Palleronia caenipelagi]|uniref:Uncharacterized protein n=1 Tax=Palleronia caenipelagi TaxID=2489174 RepID=A0A547PT28_9RHOB|nr:hypothetical protein [Palleronia caenipelagi]TRD17299.1 hypothetical protein FEV53_13275 [Palleronia caenipelagi]
MKTWILRELRGAAQRWWAHQALRDAGEVAEARRREHGKIRSDMEIIRNALSTTGAYISVGRGGAYVHFGQGCTLSHPGGLEHLATARVLRRAGLPLIDTTTVDRPERIMSLPMVAVGREPDLPPWHALSYVPLSAYAARAIKLGARVESLETLEEGTVETEGEVREDAP